MPKKNKTYHLIDPRNNYPILLHIFNDRQRETLRRYIGGIEKYNNKNYIWGEKYRTAFDVACMSGLRESEVVCLNYKRGDIDFKNNMLKVYEGCKYSKNREVPLHPTLKKILKDYIRKNKKSFRKGYIFPPGELSKSLHMSANTIRIEYQNAYDRSPYKSVFKQNGKGRLRHWNFHTCRHYFASKCIQAGCNVIELSKIMGHNSTLTTLVVYGHLFRSAREAKYEIVKKLSFKNEND